MNPPPREEGQLQQQLAEATDGSSQGGTSDIAQTEGDGVDMLVTEMEMAIKTPDAAVHLDRAPLPFIFGVKPPSDTPDLTSAYNALLGMSAVVRLYAAMNTINMRKANNVDGPYLLSKPEEFRAGFSEGAEATTQALTKNLAAYYTPSAGQSLNENELLKRSQIHDFVLTRIFKDVPNLGDDKKDELDGILTHYTKLLKSYEIASPPGDDGLKFCVVLQYVKVTDITGSGDAFIIEPHTRLVNIMLKAEEWTHALKKPGWLHRNEKISFSMVTTTTDYQLDATKYEAVKPNITSVFGQVCRDVPELQAILSKGGIEEFGRQTAVLINEEETKQEGKDGPASIGNS